MELQMGTVPNDAEFVVFVGDLRASGPTCVRSDYERASNILKLSRAPVFALIGDNDWTDCPNRDEGLSLWNEYFLNFDTHWNHKFNVQRQTGRPENFSFQNKGSLFIGLNIVGGLPRSAYVDEWNARLTDEVNWSMDLIRSYKSSTTGTGRIVIFGHANPNSSHDPFFIPLAAFIQNELQNKIPIMYINGDQHMWVYTTNFYNQVSFQRITVTGLGVDPLLKVNVVADGQFLPTDQAITYDRRLSSTFRS